MAINVRIVSSLGGFEDVQDDGVCFVCLFRFVSLFELIEGLDLHSHILSYFFSIARLS